MYHLMYSVKKISIIVLIFGLLIITMIPTIVKSQDLSEIKVLLINGKTDGEHLITVSSPSGIQLTTNQTIPYMFSSKENEKVSLQFDRYHLQLVETMDLSEAMEIIEQVKAIEEVKLLPSIEVVYKDKSDYYQVIVGGYDTFEELDQIRQLIQKEMQIDGKPLGPLHWAIGDIVDLAEAEKIIMELNANGFTGYLAQVYINDKWENQVFIGDSITFEEHQQLKNSIQKIFPDFNLVDVNSDIYVISKLSGTILQDEIMTNPLFVFSSSMIVNIKPTDSQSTLTINERTYQGKNLSYRGEINFQLFEGEIAVVNRLNLDSYLYSVVGSEMYDSWPLEALKSQAVAARTFAYQKLLNPRNKIAHIYDSIADQAYYGVSEETDRIRQAVDETKGIVLTRNGKPITAFYHSNAGGITSDGSEVWGSQIPYTSSKPSPEDGKALENVMDWYYVLRSNGQIGYVRSDYVDVIEKTHPFGLPYGVLNGDKVNFRNRPNIYRSEIITTLPKGEEIVILDTVYENNSYSWIAGPLSTEFITENVNKYQLDSSIPFNEPILDLKVMERGPSGRVTLLADGDTPIKVKYPDYYRTLLGGLSVGVQSGLFDIEQQGRIETLAAYGRTESLVNKKEQIYVQSANSKYVLSETNFSQDNYFVLGADDQIKVFSKEQSYIIRGRGLGHGLGMSQWGARGLAESGYTYQEILEYYYNDIVIKQIY
ncbi:hypothetical protein BHF71_05855 [Vulcanibacillus modesticaldus]|uniref:SPOR domain-containing protein n=1 Tax=Vulcanibacillus modesticaldus TaxID=337097 RepID=A0A1D2YX17_9BACI|nr:SpoIID/LytB domain-containing protein [Vulcanibacillus modesticaldus]OEG00210.1 hypothetical protein BHF71_05855 [Vulcanibacillus modesticaldus]